MKKRLVSILLMVAMVASLTTGCKKNKDASVTKENNQVVAALDQEAEDAGTEEKELEEGTGFEEEATDLEQEEVHTESEVEESSQKEEKTSEKNTKTETLKTSAKKDTTETTKKTSNTSGSDSKKTTSTTSEKKNTSSSSEKKGTSTSTVATSKNNTSENDSSSSSSVSNKNNGSSNSAGNSNKNNSSNSSNNSNGSDSNKEDSNNKPAHNHQWEDIYEDVWVIDQAAYTETVPVYEEREVCECKCGAQFDSDDKWDAHGDTYMDDIEICIRDHGSWHSAWIKIQTGTQTITHEEEGHWESVKVGSKCTGCGASK